MTPKAADGCAISGSKVASAAGRRRPADGSSRSNRGRGIGPTRTLWPGLRRGSISIAKQPPGVSKSA